MPVKSNKKKSSISKKKQNKSNIDLKKYKDRIKELDNQLKNMEDKNVRLLAEFDNYKRRTQEDRSNLLKFGGEGLAKTLLPILDDFHRTWFLSRIFLYAHTMFSTRHFPAVQS